MSGTATSEEIAEAEVVPSTEVVQATPAHGNLFRSDDPARVIENASNVANVLKGVLDKQGLTATISGKKHVLVEGWTTCGAMLGVVPVVEWTRQLENGWEARVEARTVDGRTIGAAEASCTRDEPRWKTAGDYAVRSMAQTRATSKALRGPLGFIVTLAGFQATPAEELSADESPSEPEFPMGVLYDREAIGKAVGAACVKLAGDNKGRGIALFKLIAKDCGGYMPQAAALALVHAADTDNLVPDVTAPEL